jgi:enoyl-CoA hydratase
MTPLATVNGEPIDTATALRHSLFFNDSFLNDAVASEAIRQYAEKTGIANTDAELQLAVDEVRYSRGLESADAGRQWMRENHQTLLSLQNAVDLMLLRNKVRSAISDAEVQAHYAEHKLEYEAVDLYSIRVESQGKAAELQTARGGFAGLVQRERTKPLIAAVDGAALAGGCEIALACDLIVASTQARFGVPEVKRSLVAAAGALFRLPRALPRAIALEMIMTGDPISAERAAHFGMVNDLCEPGQALERAKVLAERIIVNAPLAVRRSRALALTTVQLDEATGFRMSGEAMIDLANTEDFWEGPKAFIEKRDPVWKGK